MALISNLSFLLLLSLVAVAYATGYGNENAPKPKLPATPDYGSPKQLLHPFTISVQGLVYCKSGPKLTPFKGALARITCLGMEKNGYESAPFSILCKPTDAKGYFFATFSLYQFKDAVKITECKAFLESSPLQTCNCPTDANKGKTGAVLSSYRLISDKKTKLYSVGPFVYTTSTTTKPISDPKGY